MESEKTQNSKTILSNKSKSDGLYNITGAEVTLQRYSN